MAVYACSASVAILRRGDGACVAFGLEKDLDDADVLSSVAWECKTCETKHNVKCRQVDPKVNQVRGWTGLERGSL